jgi:hypothetical protein
VNTKPKKPARNAETYLIKEDQRIYKNLVETVKALKKYMYPTYTPAPLDKVLESTAARAYQDAEMEARKFWGSNEVQAVRQKERESDLEKTSFYKPRIGSFSVNNVHYCLRKKY